MNKRIRIHSLVIALVLAVAAVSRAAAPVVRVEPVIRLLPTINTGISGALARNAASRLQDLPADRQKDLLSSLDARIGPELTPDSLATALREEFLKARQDFREIQKHDAWYKKQDPKLRFNNIVNDRDDYTLAEDLLLRRRISLSPSHEKTLRALMEDLGARRRELDAQFLAVDLRRIRNEKDRLPSLLLPDLPNPSSLAKAQPADTRMQTHQAAAGAVLRLVREAIMTKDAEGKSVVIFAHTEILNNAELFLSQDRGLAIREEENKKRRDLADAAMKLQEHLRLSLAANELLDRQKFFTTIEADMQVLLTAYSLLRTKFDPDQAQRVENASQQVEEALARLKSGKDESPAAAAQAPLRPTLHPEVNKLAAIFKETSTPSALQAAVDRAKDLFAHAVGNQLTPADLQQLEDWRHAWDRAPASSRANARAKLPREIQPYDRDPDPIDLNIDGKREAVAAIARSASDFIKKEGYGISGLRQEADKLRAATNDLADPSFNPNLISEPNPHMPPPSEYQIEQLRKDQIERDEKIYEVAQQAYLLMRGYIRVLRMDENPTGRQEELIATAVKFQEILRRWRDVKISYL